MITGSDDVMHGKWLLPLTCFFLFYIQKIKFADRSFDSNTLDLQITCIDFSAMKTDKICNNWSLLSPFKFLVFWLLLMLEISDMVTKATKTRFEEFQVLFLQYHI